MSWKIEGSFAEGGFNVVRIDGAELAMSIADPEGQIANEATIHLAALCQLLSTTGEGQKAMMDALTGARQCWAEEHTDV